MGTRKHIAVVTGASRGLGRALAAALLQRQDNRVLCISRRSNPELGPSADIEQWTADLGDSKPVAQRLADWLAEAASEDVLSVTLINNAGIMPPPGPLSDTDADDLVSCIRVGLEAPFLLTAAFLNATADWSAPRRVLMMSSGLGTIARAGQSPYCAVKAGMDHCARALSLEQAALPNGAKVVSLSPGVVDTDMQAELRARDPRVFPHAERFRELKAKGLLTAPDEAARVIVERLFMADFGEAPIVDLMVK
jgi:NAD(P)-dependent dehydrogenase (short-subunit alcohol dehydrogenase family)